MTRYPKKGKGHHWTVVELKAVPADWRGDTLADGDGLFGEVRVSTQKAIAIRWKYAFRWEDKVQWFQAGTWPSTPLEQIRTRRDEARRQVAEGINPNTRKQADRIEAQREAEAVLVAEAARMAQELSVQDMFDEWVKHGVRRADGNEEICRSFEKDVLPFLGPRPVRSITEADLREVLRRVVDRGANRMAMNECAYIVQMFSWADQRMPWRKLMAEGNPAVLLEIDKIVADDYVVGYVRKRVLFPAELRELHSIFASMEAAYAAAAPGKKKGIARPVKKTTQLALWICLGTLTRIGETLMGEWKHLNFETREWFIPAANVKGATQDHLIDLSDFSLRQFRELHKLTGSGRWMFPAKHNDKAHVDVKSVTKQVADRQEQFKDRTRMLKGRRQDNSLVLASGENGDWTPHDMRRTGATMMQRLAPPDIIDRCQNHIMDGSNARRPYQHYKYEAEKREAWLKLGEKLDALFN